MYKHIIKFIQTSSGVRSLNIVKSPPHCSSVPPEFHNDPKVHGYVGWSRSFCTKESGTIEKLFSKLASKSKTQPSQTKPKINTLTEQEYPQGYRLEKIRSLCYVVKNSPNAIIIVASEPVDVLSHLAWKVSGLPKNRVLGTGTSLDTDRFRYFLAERLGVAPASCHGYIIGEHGESSVPLWSSVNIAGVRLTDINPNIGTASDPEKWQDIHKKVISSEGLLRQLKGTDSWAMALTIGNLCDAILSNSNTIHPVSTYAKGEHRIIDDVFLSLPCVLGSTGVTDVVRQKLTEHEIELLRKSAESIFRLQEYTKLMA